MRKILVLVAILLTFTTNHALADEIYFAVFFVSPTLIQTNLEPGASLTQNLQITLDNDFEYYSGGAAPYRFELDREYVEKCLAYETDEETGEEYRVEFEEIVLPNLCPHLSFLDLEDESGGDDLLGELHRVDDLDNDFGPEDLSDEWQLTIALPNEPELLGQTLICNLDIISTEAPRPLFGPNEQPNEMRLEVTVGAGLVGTLENGLVEPEIGTASSTPFIFSVDYDEIGTVNLVVTDSEMSAESEMEKVGETYTLEKQFPIGDYEYHFETNSGARFPEIGELAFRSGLFVTPKSSANLRSAPGTNSAIIGTVGHDQILELLPLNEQLDVYELVNDHYWLKGTVNGTTGFVAEDLLMTIIPDSQPERVKEKMTEVLNNGDFDNLIDAEFPLELLLAISAHESGGTLNNEVVSGDSPFSGIMQVHPRTSGTNSNCDNGGVCARVVGSDNWTELLFPFSDLFGVSTDEHNGTAFMFKNYINTQYSNAQDGLETNLNDGLTVLQDAKYSRCDNSDVAGNVWEPITWGGYTFSVPELKKACAVWLYNGQDYKESNPYLRHIGESLGNLDNVFPGTTYANTDNLIEKLKIANDHRAEIKVKSPVELRVRDSEGNTTGLVNGSEVNEIPNAVYDDIAEAVVVFFSEGELIYQVQGTANGTYGLDITETDGDEEIIFSAPAIPITEGTVHEIELDETGAIATVHVDEDADGDFEDEFTINPSDTKPPEVRIFFDFDTHHLFINGIDNFPGVEKVITPTQTIFTDAVGHTLEINWSDYLVEPRKITLGISSLAYDGMVTTFNPPVTLTYEWWTNPAGRITKLESRGEVPGQQSTIGTYKWSGTVGTTFFKKTFVSPTQSPISQSLAGAAALSLTTHNGIIHLGWPGLPEPTPFILEDLILEPLDP